MDNIEEKISALYDGELSDTEADEVLMMIGNDINLQNKLSKYALMSSAMRHQKNNLQSKKSLFAELQSKDSVDKLLKTLSQRYEKRKGGYCRVIRAGFRYGGDAPMAIIELVDRDIQAKKVDLKKKPAESEKSPNESKSKATDNKTKPKK